MDKSCSIPFINIRPSSGRLSFPGIIFIITVVFLSISGMQAFAVTDTWSGLGTDNLASTPANWVNNAAPRYGDDVVFDGTATEDCIWDISVTLASLTLNTGYTGTVTLNTDLAADGNLIVLDGVLDQNNKNLKIGFPQSVPQPTAITDPATDITTDSVTINSTVNPNDTETTVYFEWGTSTSYGKITGSASINGTADINVYANLAGLSPNATYHYRVVASNTAGTAYGDDISFTTTITLSPPAVTTDPATNVNGNSATINGTVNPNGLETTVYFEWGTSTSYGNTSTSQNIGSGIDDVTVSAGLTGLSTNTTYHYRAIATNAIDTSYGDNISFTTPGITLTITSPSDGGTIYRPDVMVRGTVTNLAGSETGVVINGIAAVVYNGEFFVNHLPLEEGENTITATATDADGYTASTLITVTAVTTEPYVTLRANIESGIAPLTTYFSVSTSIPDSVSGYDMDYEGDGTVDYTGTAFEDISYTYTTEGVYYPTVTVTDTQSITYTDTIAIVILNATDLDALLRSKWEAMTNSLSIGDTETALTYISSISRESYEEMFNTLIDQLPSITATQTEFNFISATDYLVKYELVTLEDGTVYSYQVIFIKNTDGIWMIQEF